MVYTSTNIQRRAQPGVPPPALETCDGAFSHFQTYPLLLLPRNAATPTFISESNRSK